MPARVPPGIVMFQLIKNSLTDWSSEYLMPTTLFEEGYSYLPFIGFILTMAAAYRLANFNIDERQTSSFIGIPTPANALLVLSLPLILEFSSFDFAANLIQNTTFLIVITLLGSYMMNANIPLFSLKFKNYSLKNNLIKYVFLIISIVSLLVLHYVAFPLIIVLYVALSVVENMGK